MDFTSVYEENEDVLSENQQLLQQEQEQVPKAVSIEDPISTI